MRKQVVLAALLAVMMTVQGWAMTSEQRRQYLDKVLHMLPDSPTFNAWLQKSGELPPDFDALPRINGLPDPLKFLDGKPVRTVADWRARRAEIWKLYVKYILGTFPPKPKIDRAVVLDETQGKGYLVRNVRLEFGPQSKGTIRVRVVIPDGKGPFPVLVGTSLTGWAPWCFVGATSPADTPATTPWTMRPRSRNSIRTMSLQNCLAGPGRRQSCWITCRRCLRWI